MSFRNKIAGKIEVWVLRSSIEGESDGIKICNIRSKDDGFLEIIRASLKLIQQMDPRRYKTIRNEIDWLVNSNLPDKYGARYKRSSKSCFIGFDNYSEDKLHVSAYFAGIIVHESTHGVLHSKGVGSDKTRRVQIERICTAEENRFYQKVENLYPEYAGSLVHEFDPKDWEYFWNTPKYKRFFHEIMRVFND